MNIGKNLIVLRKKNGFSQEELAEKIGVTRQTISKWELEETYPDINQTLELSKVFNVTLDELVNNDVSNVIINRIENTEKKVKKTNILVSIVIIVSLFIILFISYLFIRINNNKEQRKIFGSYQMTCELNGKTYEYSMYYNKNFEPIYLGGDDYFDNHIDIYNYNNVNQIRAHIEDYFKDYSGSCKTNEQFNN